MKKRNLFLAVALIALMTGVLSAQTYDSESDFQVTKRGNEVTIDQYKGSKAVVNIPPNIQNTPVTTIGGNAFKGYNKLTSIVIPNSVTMIQELAFFGCVSLNNLTIPASVKDIRRGAFQNCSTLTSVTFQGTMASHMIDNDAFAALGDLRAKYFATGGGIGTYTRPNTSSTTWTKAAATTTAPAQTGDSESDFQVTKTGNAITITKYVGTKTVVNIPSRIQNTPVTSIGDSAFMQNTSITSVTIPNGVTTIEETAFDGCTSLTSVTIPNSVKSIGDGAFSGCTKLTSVTIPNSVTSIGDNAFSNCYSLTSITIPSSVTKIGRYAFNSSGLNSMTFQGTITTANLGTAPFDGDLRTKYLAGGAGTYTKSGTTWTKK